MKRSRQTFVGGGGRRGRSGEGLYCRRKCAKEVRHFEKDKTKCLLGRVLDDKWVRGGWSKRRASEASVDVED